MPVGTCFIGISFYREREFLVGRWEPASHNFLHLEVWYLEENVSLDHLIGLLTLKEMCKEAYGKSSGPL